jgi:DNA polymerase-3 subunit delta
MSAHSIDTLFRALKKGELAHAYYLHGPEDILKDEAVRGILDKALDPSLRDFNYDQRAAAQLDPDDVVTLCTTVPMMADRRVVLIRDVEAWKRKTKARAAVLRYLERPVPETVLILVQGAAEEAPDAELAQRTYTVCFDPLPPDRALKWLLHRAQGLGIPLDQAGAEHLLRCVGGELGALAAELQKFAALPPGEPLTPERVGELVGVRHGETIFDWRDLVMDDQPAQAVALLPSILSQPGVSAVKLVAILGTTLVGVGIARDLLDRGSRGRSLEDAVFKTLLRNRVFGLLSYKEEAPRWARWAARWPAARVSAGLRATLNADRALKSTTISGDVAILTDLIMQLTVLHRRVA